MEAREKKFINCCVNCINSFLNDQHTDCKLGLIDSVVIDRTVFMSNNCLKYAFKLKYNETF